MRTDEAAEGAECRTQSASWHAQNITCRVSGVVQLSLQFERDSFLGVEWFFSIFCLRFWIFFGFLSWYHLPCICNSLELERVILHGICYILAWSLCILHGICYIWPCSPSILHGICHILAFQPLICMVFAAFWYFKRSCGSLEGSLGFHFGCHLRFHLGFHLGFCLGFHLGFYLGFHLGFHSGFLYGFISGFI